MSSGIILRPFFTETPYAASLCTEILVQRCSGCFGSASDRWLCHCGKVAYCSEKCLSSDLRWHEAECLAFRTNSRPKSAANELDVRLLGRLIARYQVDNGVAVLTSPGFPSNLVKDRTLGDLISHERDFARKTSFEKYTTSMLAVFYAFFKSTPLGSLKSDLIKHWYYVACINGFSITSLTSPESPDSMSYLGESVYLNSSRFNHSCRPSLHFGFDGCRLVVKYIDYEGDSTQCKIIKKKQFKALTFNYGFGSSWSYGCSFSTAAQRSESLKVRYFFRCRCELCRDKLTNIVQLDSSSIECSRCGKPYVWRMQNRSRKAKLTKICRCPLDPAVANKTHWCHKPDVQQAAKILSERWKTTMESVSKVQDIDMVIQECEAIRPVAVQYWNRSYNVRLGQLCEKLFEAHNSKVRQIRRKIKSGQSTSTTLTATSFSSAADPDSQFQDVLKAAVEMGETMMASYKRYMEPYNLSMAQLAHRMAELYRLYHSKDALERGSNYFLTAADVWKLHGEHGCETFFREQSARLLARAKSVKEKTESNVINGELVTVSAK